MQTVLESLRYHFNLKATTKEAKLARQLPKSNHSPLAAVVERVHEARLYLLPCQD